MATETKTKTAKKKTETKTETKTRDFDLVQLTERDPPRDLERAVLLCRRHAGRWPARIRVEASGGDAAVVHYFDKDGKEVWTLHFQKDDRFITGIEWIDRWHVEEAAPVLDKYLGERGEGFDALPLPTTIRVDHSFVAAPGDEDSRRYHRVSLLDEKGNELRREIAGWCRNGDW